MSIVYAEPFTGKTALARLKGVATKWKKKQLSLPAFMEIAPDAPYDEWETRLADISRRFRNTGQQEAVNLCIFLETHFKDEQNWRGLLNQLGRLHIEARVEQLAKAPSPSDLLQQNFNVLAHEVATLIGAPDAEAVVRDLFEENDIRLPEPGKQPSTAARPDPPPDPEPDPEPESKPEVDPEPEPETTGKPSVWATLGNLFLTGAVEVLKARAEVARHQIANELDTFKQTANVAGTWWGGQGAYLSFAQRGVQLQLQGQAMNQAVSGQGIVRGRQVELLVWLLPQRSRLSILLDVTPDGGMMRGTARDDYGRTMPVNLQR